MNKHRFNYLVLGGMALLMSACNNSESDLLEPKLYLKIGNMYSRWKMKVG